MAQLSRLGVGSSELCGLDLAPDNSEGSNSYDEADTESMSEDGEKTCRVLHVHR